MPNTRILLGHQEPGWIAPAEKAGILAIDAAKQWSGTAAIGTATFSGKPANNDTVTINGKVYTFQSVLTNSDGNVLIAGNALGSMQNLMNAINLGPGAGTNYAAAMTKNPVVFAYQVQGNGGPQTPKMRVQAKGPGAWGNAITTTKVSVNTAWGGATLAGGAATIVDVVGEVALRSAQQR